METSRLWQFCAPRFHAYGTPLLSEPVTRASLLTALLQCVRSVTYKEHAFLCFFYAMCWRGYLYFATLAVYRKRPATSLFKTLRQAGFGVESGSCHIVSYAKLGE